MSASTTDEPGAGLPFAQFVGQTLQVLILLVGGGHEPGKLGGRQCGNFTVVKSGEPVR